MKRIVSVALGRLVLLALLVTGVYVVALEPILVPVGFLIALGVLAVRTRPRARRDLSRAELVTGVGIYPITCIAIYLALRTLDAFAAALLIFPTTALLFALLLGRLWLAVAPVTLVGLLLLAAYISDPSCSACGENTWGYSIAMSGVLFAAPSVLAVEIGVLIYNLRRNRPAARLPETAHRARQALVTRRR